MEKILDFSDAVTYRFQCDCYTPAHALDVEVLKDAPDSIILAMYTTPDSWVWRMKYCWRMLRTGMGFEHEFVLRKTDVPELVKILTEAGNAVK